MWVGGLGPWRRAGRLSKMHSAHGCTRCQGSLHVPLCTGRRTGRQPGRPSCQALCQSRIFCTANRGSAAGGPTASPGLLCDMVCSLDPERFMCFRRLPRQQQHTTAKRSAPDTPARLLSSASCALDAALHLTCTVDQTAEKGTGPGISAPEPAWGLSAQRLNRIHHDSVSAWPFRAPQSPVPTASLLAACSE